MPQESALDSIQVGRDHWSPRGCEAGVTQGSHEISSKDHCGPSSTKGLSDIITLPCFKDRGVEGIPESHGKHGSQVSVCHQGVTLAALVAIPRTLGEPPGIFPVSPPRPSPRGQTAALTALPGPEDDMGF